MKRRHLITVLVPALLLAAAVATPQPARGQLLITQALAELSNVGSRVDAMVKNRLANAMREKNLEKYRTALLDARKELSPALKEIREKLGQARTARDAKRAMLKDYFDRYGTTDKWPAEHLDKARDVDALDQATGQLEGVEARLAATSERALKIWVHLQNQTGKGFSQGLQWYKAQSDGLAASLDALRGTIDTARASWTPSAAPPLRITNESKDVAYTLGGVTLKPGETKRMSVAVGTPLHIQAVAWTPRRQFIDGKGKNPTRHATIEATTPYTLRFVIDTGAGATRTSWQAQNEVYHWFIDPPSWKVPTTATVSSSGDAQDDIVTFKVPFVPKDRFGRDGFVRYYLSTRGAVEWLYTRRGAAPGPDKTERERFEGGPLLIDVYAN